MCVSFNLNSFLQNPCGRSDEPNFSVETIIDALLVMYDECCSSSFKREQTVVEFVEAGKLQPCITERLLSSSVNCLLWTSVCVCVCVSSVDSPSIAV